ncbi:tetratricopeptide repeat protein, partial [Thermodesulfobacteriota bacterium]
PSIAVLPFTNMSGDPKQEYLCDGITEQIITALSKIPKLFVIARNSTFTYKGKPVKIKTVAEELGVRYVLEGSVQRSGDRIRITAQLIDSLKGDHLWAERYDRTLKDIFVLQDEITMNVVEALHIKLTIEGVARSASKGTQNLEAFLKFLQGFDYWIRFNPDTHIKAKRYFQEAIDLDPNYAPPYVFLGHLHMANIRQGLSKSPKKSMAEAFKFAEKALELDETHSPVYALFTVIYLFRRQYDKAIAAGEQGLSINPNEISTLAVLANALTASGKPEDGIPYLKRAIRVNPLDPTLAIFSLAWTYCFMEKYEEAIPLLRQVTQNRPKMFNAHLVLAAAYAGLGKTEEAREAAAEALKLNPKFNLARYGKILPHKDIAVKERYLSNLRKAGFPDKPSMKLPDKPSIAVLPFTNMSGDPEQEYFSDGITEDIITKLSKVSGIFVISRNSSFLYKGKQKKIQDVAKDLGVRYVLEGSIRRGGNKVRITAQLIDAKTDQHVWAESYDRELKDIFSVQDDVTQKVVAELAVALTVNEYDRVVRKHTENFEAYDLFLKARNLAMAVGSKKKQLKAKELGERIIELDPNFAGGYSIISLLLGRDIRFGHSTSPREDLKKAFELAQKALAVDNTFAPAYYALASTYLMKRQHDKVVTTMRDAVKVQPGDAMTWGFFAFYLHWASRGEEAIEAIEKALQLNPKYKDSRNPIFFDALGLAYFAAGRYEESITAWKSGIDHLGPMTVRQAFLAASYSELGRDGDAKATAQKLLRLNPNFALKSWKYAYLYKNPEDTERLLKALSKAGLE